MKKICLIAVIALALGACNSNNNRGKSQDTIPERNDYPGTDRSNTDQMHTDSMGRDSMGRGTSDTVNTGYGR
ncbi:hypothetical protein Pedsa_1297 [Pseudopedobacter saltans DSM 12145]|uniref:Lipoprotein n=1 Tax=Pseudopedobacter saltans (strain ATCC 51119 / DSM 12145 / JCM 21818 / CCUG 39354 / LMG 10337 / NBRC 100064 / NCIMB 13643) TaxID=762903 RepID=F0SDW8_PSESL|nr:membrane lipoprotein lipid attachment site-containing protein [Pseudopedobacter saltans]ADY51864.1 hypothetical protein Pedsa_1297 [Pseudopedobacter saltans DSM 12145]